MKIPEYFVGKVCSIFTTPHSRDLHQEDPNGYPGTLYRYFVGEVEKIDASGVIIRNMAKNLRTFVPLDKIVAVAEEEVLDPNNPEDAKVIEQYHAELKKNLPESKTVFQNQYVDPDAMSKLADGLSQKFGR
jgi:hypothetical protein